MGEGRSIFDVSRVVYVVGPDGYRAVYGYVYGPEHDRSGSWVYRVSDIVDAIKFDVHDHVAGIQRVNVG
jgi:hypothetical protein